MLHPTLIHDKLVLTCLICCLQQILVYRAVLRSGMTYYTITSSMYCLLWDYYSSLVVVLKLLIIYL